MGPTPESVADGEAQRPGSQPEADVTTAPRPGAPSPRMVLAELRPRPAKSADSLLLLDPAANTNEIASSLPARDADGDTSPRVDIESPSTAPVPIPRARTNRSLRPDSGLASMNSPQEPAAQSLPTENRVRIQGNDFPSTAPGGRPFSAVTSPIIKTTAPPADTRSLGGKSIGTRSLGGRSVGTSILTPEDELLSLKVRSLYDSGVGTDSCSQFSGDGSRKRVSSILEERGMTERGYATKRGFRNSFAEGMLSTASVAEKNENGHGRRHSESDGGLNGTFDDQESRDSSLDEDHAAEALEEQAERPSQSLVDNEFLETPGVSVDRYGFVSQEYITTSSTSVPERPFTAPKRVATNLFAESSQPRRKRTQALHHLHFHRSAPEMLQAPLPGHTRAMRDKESSRSRKWREMAVKRKQTETGLEGGKGAGVEWSFVTRDPKLISRTWKGIPDCWRGAAWHAFLTASAKKRGIGKGDAELTEIYTELIEMPSADDVQIDLDVPRTISDHIMFRKRYEGGQRLLFRILHCLGLYFPEVGYVQGMASLAATLLCYYEEVTAFIMLVRLWELRGLEKIFKHGFDGLIAALEEFENGWMKGGAVSKKLKEMGIDGTAYGTRWYLTLFHYSIPFAAQLRVWDVFMLLGDPDPNSKCEFGGTLDVLHATSAALIDGMKSIILNTDFEGSMKCLTSFIPVKDEDMLMKVAKVEWKTKRRRRGASILPP